GKMHVLFFLSLISAAVGYPRDQRGAEPSHNGAHFAPGPQSGHHSNYYNTSVNYYYGKLPGEKEDTSKREDDKRVWKFSTGDEGGAYEFLDDDGYLRGFHIDFIKKLCERAEKECVYIQDAYNHCWETKGDKEYPGKGLLDGWYDACVGWWPYPRRRNSFNFTIAFTKVDRANVYYLEGNKKFNPKDFTNTHIGFLDGWATNKFCLADQGTDLAEKGTAGGSYHEFYYKVHKEMVKALENGVIDAFVSPDSVFNPANVQGLKAVSEDGFVCTRGEEGAGHAFMAQYKNPVIDWLNEAMLSIYDDGTFRELCKKSQHKYNSKGKIRCLD
ncbi:unnamed protein product, partial [Owenia fusiformis]